MSEIIIAYDVLRVINAKPLFAKDHFIRLKNSVLSVNPKIIFSEEIFKSEIFKIIKTDKIKNGNIKTQIIIDKQNQSYSVECKQIPHQYPTVADYRLGVDAMTYKFTRDNPHNKIWNQGLREITNKMIIENKVYEVLYINDKNCLTEGSRSNLFFINENELISAPASEILLGVTRKFILEEAERTGLTLIEKAININEIDNYNSAFISGTSPKILPIKKIGKKEFDVNNLKLRLLMQNFDKHIQQDINSFKF